MLGQIDCSMYFVTPVIFRYGSVGDKGTLALGLVHSSHQSGNTTLDINIHDATFTCGICVTMMHKYRRRKGL